MKSQSILLWRHLLALALAALLVVQLATTAGGSEASDDEADLELNHQDTVTDEDQEEQHLWAGSSGGGIISRMLLATSGGSSKPKPPHKCYRSNCNKNDTNIAVCKKEARDAKSASIQCCKVNPTFSICVDLSSNSRFCGTCTIRCPAGQICCRGECVATCCDGACFAGQGCCNNRCVELNTDTGNCGACGAACPADPPGSPGFYACCGGSCTIVLGSDEGNCGICGSFCNDRCCAGTCRNTWTDPDFCNSCDPVQGKCPPDARICCDHACYNSTPTDIACQG